MARDGRAVLVLFDSTTHNAVVEMSADAMHGTMGCEEDINFMLNSLVSTLPDPID